MERLAQHIESLIFTAESPVTIEEISSTLEATFGMKFPPAELERTIQHLSDRYQDEESAIEIVHMEEGYRMLTKGAYHQTVGNWLKLTSKRRLSKSALETLSIIAYKQPVTKTEMEQIRGVSCDYSIQKLLEKELVEISGRSDGPGRPLLYGTSRKFMDYFGLGSLADLPRLKEFAPPESSIGEPAPIEEAVSDGPPAAEEE